MAPLATDLKKILKGEVYDDEESLIKFSEDTSLFRVRPQVVVSPKDSDDLKALVKYASEKDNVYLTARSGGTGMDGGALGESIVLDFISHFDKMGDALQEEIDETKKGRIRVEPGVYYRDFEERTLKKNLLMPSYPASREICAIGGMVSNNAGGELTLSYGKVEDYVRSLKVVLSDGNEYVVKPLSASELGHKIQQGDFEGQLYKKLYNLIAENYALIESAKPKVSKNSAGYFLWNVWDRATGVFDLTKLIVGSQGTLGLVTEVEFDLVRPNKHSQMMVLFLDDLSQLGHIAQTVLKHNPTTFESYDDKTLRLAVKFIFPLLAKLGLSGFWTLFTNGIPEALSIIRHGFPKMVLQITFEGDDQQLLRERAQNLQAELGRFMPRYSEVIKNPKEAEEYWLIRRESFNLLRHKIKGKKTAPFIDDIVVRPEVLPEFLPRVDKILDEYKDYMIHNIAGHIGNGNFHIIPLMDLKDDKARAIIPEVADRVYDLVIEYGGSITGEHNDGIIRTPYLKKQFGEQIVGLFEETKRIFDPKNIFNRGKKVNGTLEYAIEHIKKTT